MPRMPRQSIVLATTTPALAAGLEQWLDGGRVGWEVLAIAGSSSELREIVLGQTPSIVISSACLDGLLVMAELADVGVEVPLLVLADLSDPTDEVDLLRAGADGVISVKTSRQDLLRAVGDLLDGRSVASTGAMRRLIAEQPLRLDLTPRQGEIMVLLADGATTEEIAEGLVVTQSTVKTHIGRLATRFGLSGRVELAREASRILAEAGVMHSGVVQPTELSANGVMR
jgi:DNA-binding NarL/FixJ family response regulator